MRRHTSGIVHRTVITVVLFVLVVGAIGPQVAADHPGPPDAIQDGDGYELILPQTNGPYSVDGKNSTTNPLDRSPKATDVTYQTFLHGNASLSYNVPEANQAADVNYTVLWAPYSNSCSEIDVRAFGVDRDDDASGTTIDESAIPWLKNNYVVTDVPFPKDLSSNDYDYVEMTVLNWRMDDETGEPFILNPEDEFVAELDSCYTNPPEPGWYRSYSFSNATTMETNDRGYSQGFSHWFYICDCDSRAEAIETLGPPPSNHAEAVDPTHVRHDVYVGATRPVDAPADAMPGADEASIVSVTPVTVREPMTVNRITIKSEAMDNTRCAAYHTPTFGLDRGGDDPGATTDEDLTYHVEDVDVYDNRTVVNFIDASDPFRSSVTFEEGDELVIEAVDCYQNPESAGWYASNTTVTGIESDDTHVEYTSTSWQWFCDCANEEEARERLGPPPHEATVETDTPTATATENAATDTPTQTDAATATTAATAGPTTTEPAVTTTAGATGSPTAGGGPGFGVTVGVLAVGLVALLLGRRH